MFCLLLDADSLHPAPSVSSFFKIDILTLQVLHALHLLKVVLSLFFWHQLNCHRISWILVSVLLWTIYTYIFFFFSNQPNSARCILMSEALTGQASKAAARLGDVTLGDGGAWKWCVKVQWSHFKNSYSLIRALAWNARRAWSKGGWVRNRPGQRKMEKMPFSNSKVSVIEIVFKGKPNTYEIAAKDEALSFSFWLNLSSHLYLSDTVCEAVWAAAEGPAI